MVVMNIEAPAARAAATRTMTRTRTAAHNRVFGRGNSGTIPPARTLPGAVLPAGLAADFVARQLQPSGE